MQNHKANQQKSLKALTINQIKEYDEKGFLSIESFVRNDWLSDLKKITYEMIEESRKVKETNNKFVVECNHSSENPRLLRLNMPQDQHEIYAKFAMEGPILNLAEDLLGPDIKFHHGKLNFKWSGGGSEIKWHQDIPFWPHTAYNVLTIGVALDDISDQMGPMGVMPGSHKGPIYDHYNKDGKWCGYIDDIEIEKLNLNKIHYLKGPAGSVTIHHCRAIHGSLPNNHPKLPRPFLLFAYSAANCLPLTPYNQPSKFNGMIVRGENPTYPKFEGEPCKLPPVKLKSSIRSIFQSQQEE